MATKTAGTKATTTLTALQSAGTSSAGLPSDADIASIVNAIINDADPPALQPGAWSRLGLLYVPNRGILKVLPNDWVAVGPDGFPYLIPAVALPTTLTATGDTHTSTTLDNLSVSAYTMGWRIGTVVTSSNADIPTATPTTITKISADGKTLTLSAAATATNAGGTITAGSFTHS